MPCGRGSWQGHAPPASIFLGQRHILRPVVERAHQPHARRERYPLAHARVVGAQPALRRGSQGERFQGPRLRLDGGQRVGQRAAAQAQVVGVGEQGGVVRSKGLRLEKARVNFLFRRVFSAHKTYHKHTNPPFHPTPARRLWPRSRRGGRLAACRRARCSVCVERGRRRLGYVGGDIGGWQCRRWPYAGSESRRSGPRRAKGRVSSFFASTPKHNREQTMTAPAADADAPTASTPPAVDTTTSVPGGQVRGERGGGRARRRRRVGPPPNAGGLGPSFTPTHAPPHPHTHSGCVIHRAGAHAARAARQKAQTQERGWCWRGTDAWCRRRRGHRREWVLRLGRGERERERRWRAREKQGRPPSSPYHRLAPRSKSRPTAPCAWPTSRPLSCGCWPTASTRGGRF